MKKTKLDTRAALSLRKTLSERRSLTELAGYLTCSSRRLASTSPAGDRRPILVIPGFLCNDVSTWPLRRFLRKIGYRSFAWKQGLNWGPRPGVRTRLLHRLGEIHARCGEPVTLIGWSLGGVYARELACIRPDLVREVITLGSPLKGPPERTAVWGVFRWLNRKYLTPRELDGFEFPYPTQTPCLSIFTKEDGIVPWQLCIGPRGHCGRHASVRGTHIGLVANPEVMRMLGMHLASERRAPKRAPRSRRRQPRVASRRATN